MNKPSASELEKAIETILKYIGENPKREGLKDTPKRVRKFYDEWFLSKEEINSTLFSEKYSNMVIIKNIPFYSFCEHHMLPFIGQMSIGYLPNGKVLGLSKLIRIVKKHTKKLQIQERIGKQIADDIEKATHVRGVMVVIEAEHLCMSMRGVESPGHNTITSEIRGLFKKIEVRTEFLQLIK
ncbi:MAG: GTP cyclohydrolase I FolE [Candidatus ainarchaeum sp.]|nr:GTP cyclohydrolase I FolE [Candidatus ainarchaeum sp.]